MQSISHDGLRPVLMDVKWLPRDIFLPALEEEEFVVEQAWTAGCWRPLPKNRCEVHSFERIASSPWTLGSRSVHVLMGVK